MLWCYLSLVLFHAGYLEALPKEMAPWVAFAIAPAAWWVNRVRADASPGRYVFLAAVALVFAVNYLRVLAGFMLDPVPGHATLPIAYAALLYGGYYLIAGRQGLREVKLLLVYAGHIMLMSAAVRMLDVGIIQSTAWGLLALACLGLSMWKNDRMLAQSSLLVFGATAGKVLLYDLSGSPPLARIISLVVLGLTFYVGGLLYQKLAATRGAA